MSSYKDKAQEMMSEGDFAKAINYYTLAIKNDTSNSKLYSSRAKAYYSNMKNLDNVTPQQWKKVIEDCSNALNLDKQNYDAMFYMGLSHVHGHKKFDKGLKLLKQAYEKSLIKSKSSKQFSLPQEIYIAIIKIKKMKQIHEKQNNIINSNPFFTKLVYLLQKNYENGLQKLIKKNYDSIQLDRLTAKMAMDYNQEIKSLIELFSLQEENTKEGSHSGTMADPPEYLCDPISFNLFFEPIITPSGQSFEKSWLYQHLSKNEFDPLTRQKLTKSQCYPNLGLKFCVDQYIESNI